MKTLVAFAFSPTLLLAHQARATILTAFQRTGGTTGYAEYGPAIFDFVEVVLTGNLGGNNGPITALAFDAGGSLNIAVQYKLCGQVAGWSC